MATLKKHEDVKALLGRQPRGPFDVVLRDDQGGPVVIRNGPVLDDGTPMPTRYWLVGRQARLAVDRLEAGGGVERGGGGRRPRRTGACPPPVRGRKGFISAS